MSSFAQQTPLFLFVTLATILLAPERARGHPILYTVRAWDAPGSIGHAATLMGRDSSDDGGEKNYILVGDEQVSVLRNGVRDKSRLWPGATIPYVIKDDFPDDIKALIRTAMTELENDVSTSKGKCVQFVPRTNQRNYLEIDHQKGCHSAIGFYDIGAHPSSLGPGCEMKGIIMHEMIHVLGFYHEQNRYDRDRYVNINETNVTDRGLHDFRIRNSTILDPHGAPYDMESIMHYSPYTMAANRAYPVLTPKPELAKGQILGQRFALTPIDVIKVQRQYNCPEDTSNLVSDISPANLHTSCNFDDDTCDFHVKPASTDVTSWIRITQSTPDGPKAGYTNGLDPFLYVSVDTSLMTWLEKNEQEMGKTTESTKTLPVETTMESKISTQTGKSTEGKDVTTINASTKEAGQSVTKTTSAADEKQTSTKTMTSTAESLTRNPTTADYLGLSTAPPAKTGSTDGVTGNAKSRGTTAATSGPEQPVTKIGSQTKIASTTTTQTKTTKAKAQIRSQNTETEATKTAQDDTSSANLAGSSKSPKLRASLFTPIMKSETAFTCLQFGIYQKDASAKLTVYIAGPLLYRQPVQEYSGALGDHWGLVRLSIQLPVGLWYQLELEATADNGAIALDDIYILKMMCP